MELRHLRYFVAVAETLNLRKAAQRLCISAPPLTVQIRDLEAEIGTALLSRRSKGPRLELTDAGRVFLEQARQMLAQAGQSVTLARRAASGEIGRLTIGYNTVAALGVLPRILPALGMKWPGVRITWHSLKTPQQVEALSREELDLGFVCPPIPPDTLELQELTRQPFIAVLPASYPLARAPAVSWLSLSEQPLILYSRLLDPDSFRQIEQHFTSAGANMRIVCELESCLSMIALVAAGNGSCIVPEYARSLCGEGVVCKPIDPPGIHRTLAVARKKGRSGLAESFYQFVVDTLTTTEYV
jgi:DNA-binding transcriptional LysR family regulator